MITAIKNFFIGSYVEFKKVIWPNRKVVTSHTIIVVISTAVAMALLTLSDLGLSTLVKMLVQGK